MVKALFDTHILIDFLNGIPPARQELAHYTDRSLSIVTWMEVMIGADAAVADQTAHHREIQSRRSKKEVLF